MIVVTLSDTGRYTGLIFAFLGLAVKILEERHLIRREIKCDLYTLTGEYITAPALKWHRQSSQPINLGVDVSPR